MKTRSWLATSVIASFLVAGAARADDSIPPAETRTDAMLHHVAVGFELGVGAFEEGQPFAFGEGTGSGTSPGPSWGVRIGWEFLPWLALDAHYLGVGNLINRDYAPLGSARLITNAAMIELRLTAPTPIIQPYIFGGGGIYSTVATANTAFNNSTQPGFPMGIGISFPINSHVSLGAEATYHFLLGESFSSIDAISGGDLTTFNAVLRARL